MGSYISNFDSLATTPLRKDALTIVESAYEAIDTRAVIAKQCRLDGDILFLESHSYDTRYYEHIYLIGIGKASSTAISALESVLGDKVSEGIVQVEVHHYSHTHYLSANKVTNSTKHFFLQEEVFLN